MRIDREAEDNKTTISTSQYQYRERRECICRTHIPKREEEDNESNAELFSYRTFHNNRMADDQFQHFLQALIDKPIITIQHSVYSEGEHLHYLGLISFNF